MKFLASILFPPRDDEMSNNSTTEEGSAAALAAAETMRHRRQGERAISAFNSQIADRSLVLIYSPGRLAECATRPSCTKSNTLCV
jgi:hypothetical protein